MMTWVRRRSSSSTNNSQTNTQLPRAPQLWVGTGPSLFVARSNKIPLPPWDRKKESDRNLKRIFGFVAPWVKEKKKGKRYCRGGIGSRRKHRSSGFNDVELVSFFPRVQTRKVRTGGFGWKETRGTVKGVGEKR